MIFYLYLTIVLACFIISLKAYPYIPAFKLFPWIMGLTLFIEIGTTVMVKVFVVNPFPVYHFSSPILGGLTFYFFYLVIEEVVIRNLLKWIGLVYIMISLGLSFFFYSLTDYPGLSLNMQGFILIGCSLYVLLTLEPIFHIPIYKHPLAWICIGFIVYYCGTFFLNGVYNYLVESGSKDRRLIHGIINNGLNCLLYTFILIGLIFSHQLKKMASQ